jgi:hypothetical protein
MKLEQKKWTSQQGWQNVKGSLEGAEPQLVFVFAHTAFFKNHAGILEVRSLYPSAILAGCSTSGEIADTEVHEGSISLTAVHFDSTEVRAFTQKIESPSESFETGQKLGNLFDTTDLAYVMLLTDGLVVNGTKLLAGLRASALVNIEVTGGMAGDAADFKETFVLDENGEPQRGMIAALGFYSKTLKVGFASMGGWDSFGTERVITKSESNILYELDGQPALSVYKTYLGDQAEKLPGSALLFPLSMRAQADKAPVVRTILGVDETTGSMTFAGDMPQGASVRLMRANVDRLIDGAEIAAKTAIENYPAKPELALLVSCVGRKLVMKQVVEEEIEAVRSVLGQDTYLAGFYSYGEICPFEKGGFSELHNQTMTITLLSE